MSNNKLYRFIVSEDLKKKLQSIVAGAGGVIQLEGLYQRSFLTNNEFFGGDSDFVMEHLALNSNSFEKEGGLDAGSAIVRAGIYVGNFASDDIRLFNASQVNQKAANVTINIVDL
jgi:hypothetical protein